MWNNAKRSGLVVAATLLLLFGVWQVVTGAEPTVPAGGSATAEGEEAVPDEGSEAASTHRHVSLPCAEKTHNIVVAPARSTLSIFIESSEGDQCYCWRTAEDALAFMKSETDYVLANGTGRTNWMDETEAGSKSPSNQYGVLLGPPGGSPVEYDFFCYTGKQIEDYVSSLLTAPGESSGE